MQGSAAELFHTWHDFYLLVGTASATLVGLMFVAATLGASVFSEQHRNAMQAFISPTVVNFAAALFICIGVMVPSQTWLSLGLLLSAGGVAGLIYAGRVWVQMFVRRSFHVDMVDRMFYATVPLLGYLWLREYVPMARRVGIVLIVFGVFLVSRTPPRTTAPISDQSAN